MTPSGLRMRGFLVIVMVAFVSVALGQQDRAKQPLGSKAKQPTARIRYPLPYPPALADGKIQATEKSPAFLKPGPNLRPGVVIAKEPPLVEFAFYPKQDYPGNP